MILTTTNNIENHTITNYLGIVTGVTFKTKTASLKNAFNTNAQNKAFAMTLNQAKEEAFQQLKNNAKQLGANAIVGIKVDIEITSQFYKHVVSVTGTAVTVK